MESRITNQGGVLYWQKKSNRSTEQNSVRSNGPTETQLTDSLMTEQSQSRVKTVSSTNSAKQLDIHMQNKMHLDTDLRSSER